VTTVPVLVIRIILHSTQNQKLLLSREPQVTKIEQHALKSIFQSDFCAVGKL
jgi:hypothetical protein